MAPPDAIWWAMTTLSRSVQAIADRQCDVVAMSQLEGVTRAEWRANVQAKRWRHPARSVLVLHNGALTAQQRQWVALLAGPPGSALGGPTAARLDGLIFDHLRVDNADIPHLVLPHGARERPLVDAVVHWSTRLTSVDLHPTLQPRRTRLPRSVVDAASWQPSERVARGLVLAAVQQRLTTPQQLDAALVRRANCRHRAVIAESILDAIGGVASLPEHEFIDILRAYHLPLPTRQVVRQRPGGRYYLDVVWEQYGLSAEIEGLHHFDAEQRERDLDRLNELLIGGDRPMLFSSYAVRRRKEKVGTVLHRALTARGFQE